MPGSQQMGKNTRQQYVDTIVAQSNTNKTNIAALQSAVNSYSFTSNTSTGAFGIGKTTPSARLHVKNTPTYALNGSVSVVVGSDAPQIDIVTLRADVANDLNNAYWYLVSAQNATNYVIWYNVNGAGVDPYPATATALGVATSVAVSVATGASAIVVAQATQAAINALGDFSVPATATDTITITRAANGWAAIPVDGNVAGTWATAQTQIGLAGSDVIGVGTLFTTSLQAGDAISIANQIFTVNKVISNTRLVVDSALTASVTGVQIKKDIELLRVENGDRVGKFVIAGDGTITTTAPVLLASYTAEALPPVGTAGGIIFVPSSTGAVAPMIAYSDGTNWRRADDGAVVVP